MARNLLRSVRSEGIAQSPINRNKEPNFGGFELKIGAKDSKSENKLDENERKSRPERDS